MNFCPYQNFTYASESHGPGEPASYSWQQYDETYAKIFPGMAKYIRIPPARPQFGSGLSCRRNSLSPARCNCDEDDATNASVATTAT